jgi:hypothetical protein
MRKRIAAAAVGLLASAGGLGLIVTNSANAGPARPPVPPLPAWAVATQGNGTHPAANAATLAPTPIKMPLMKPDGTPAVNAKGQPVMVEVPQGPPAGLRPPGQ